MNTNPIPKAKRSVVNLTFRICLWLSLPAPLAWIAFKFFGNGPSANPAQELTHLFGRVAIYAIAANLILGTFFWLTRTNKFVASHFSPHLGVPLLRYRRHLGVTGFLFLATHVGFHFLNEAGIPEGIAAIIKAQYLWVGTAGFLLVALLAMTSNDLAVRSLGRRWKPLHRLTYLAFALATLHTLMIEKADLIHFGILGFATALPLVIRLGFWAQRQRKARNARR